MSAGPFTEFFVEIVETSTGKVEKRMGPMSERRAEKVERGAIMRIDIQHFFVRSGTDEVLKKEAADREPEITLRDLERAGIVSSEPRPAKSAGSSPALAVACPVCNAPIGAYCFKGHGKIQIVSHKKRRELAEKKGPQ